MRAHLCFLLSRENEIEKVSQKHIAAERCLNKTIEREMSNIIFVISVFAVNSEASVLHENFVDIATIRKHVAVFFSKEWFKYEETFLEKRVLHRTISGRKREIFVEKLLLLAVLTKPLLVKVYSKQRNHVSKSGLALELLDRKPLGTWHLPVIDQKEFFFETLPDGRDRPRDLRCQCPSYRWFVEVNAKFGLNMSFSYIYFLLSSTVKNTVVLKYT